MAFRGLVYDYESSRSGSVQFHSDTDAMAFTVPHFNVTANLWYGHRVPDDGAPDASDQPCQFYVPPRGLFDVTPGELELWVPPIYFRMPIDQHTSWVQTTIVEVLPGSGRYFRARWKEVMHMGFPNEYLMIVIEQCMSDGVPFIRDVEGGSPPVGHTGVGDGEFSLSLVGDGSGGDLPPSHEGIGSGAMGWGNDGDGTGTNT